MYSLMFFVSKLEDVRGGDGGELPASVAGDDESIEGTEQAVSQEQLAQLNQGRYNKIRELLKPPRTLLMPPRS